MGRAFIAMAAIGLAFCVVFPALLPFVIAGITVGVLPVLVERGRRIRNSQRRSDSSREKRTAHMVGTVALIASVIAVLASGAAVLFQSEDGLMAPSVPTEVVIPVTYLGMATYRGSPERLVIVDHLTVSLSAMRSVAHRYRWLQDERAALSRGLRTPSYLQPAVLPAARLKLLVARELIRDGWKLKAHSTEGDRYQRHRRTVSLHSRTVPMDTGNEIPLPTLPRHEEGGILLRLRLDPHSRMNLLAPTRTFDATRPDSDREQRLASDLEERHINLTGFSKLEVDVRSPWLRSGVVSGFAGWMASAGSKVFGILLGILIAVMSKPVEGWVRRRLKIKEPAGENS